jgi:hypothetical protein
MTRILSLVLVCGSIVSAANRAETTTYVEGNITGVAPNTGGTLLFSDDKAMYFRTGLATVAVPYPAIVKAELGATREISHGAPIYKVWARHKKTETQFLKVEFKGDDGEDKNMTLELAQSSAPGVLSAIQDHQAIAKAAAPEPAVDAAPAPAPKEVAKAAPAPAPAPVASVKPAPSVDKNDKGAVASPPKPGTAWWGDTIWKTQSNAATWTKPAGAIAPEE